jgi:hypothetical protein
MTIKVEDYLLDEIKEIKDKQAKIYECMILVKKDTESLLTWKDKHQKEHKDSSRTFVSFNLTLIISFLSALFGIILMFLKEKVMK